MIKKKKAQGSPQVKFKYFFPDDYRPVYTNGVWGGMNIKGEFEVHFLYDRRPLPLYSTHEIKDGALLGSPKEIESGESILRFVQTGVIMDLGTAKSLYDWLGDKLKAFEIKTDENK